MKKANATQTLQKMMAWLVMNLEELKELQDTGENDFAYGEKTAYIECLEAIACWKKAEQFGLNYDIEERYPL